MRNSIRCMAILLGVGLNWLPGTIAGQGVDQLLTLAMSQDVEIRKSSLATLVRTFEDPTSPMTDEDPQGVLLTLSESALQTSDEDLAVDLMRALLGSGASDWAQWGEPTGQGLLTVAIGSSSEPIRLSAVAVGAAIPDKVSRVWFLGQVISFDGFDPEDSTPVSAMLWLFDNDPVGSAEIRRLWAADAISHPEVIFGIQTVIR